MEKRERERALMRRQKFSHEMLDSKAGAKTPGATGRSLVSHAGVVEVVEVGAAGLEVEVEKEKETREDEV